MRIEDFSFYPGKITYNEFHIDFSIDIGKQIEHLNEDLLQVCYPDGYLLDLGWYPERQENGRFIIQVISQMAWDSPVYKAEAANEKELACKMNEAISFIRSNITAD